jgi:hypothetical protein
MPRPLLFENIIFVDDDAPEHPLFQHFQKSMLVDSVTNPLSRQYRNKIYIFQHAGALAGPMANTALDSLRTAFTR